MMNVNLLWYNALDAVRKRMEVEWGRVIGEYWSGPYNDNSYMVSVQNFNLSEEVTFEVTFEEGFEMTINGEIVFINFPKAILKRCKKL